MTGLRSVMLAVAALCAVLVVGCSGAVDLEGRYQAVGQDNVVLELRDNGKGTFSTEDDEVAFTWDVRKGEVWLHTKSGGLIPVRMGEDGKVVMDVPGVGPFVFERTGP